MCGILGVFGSLPSQRTFEIARDSMSHRGPDAADLFFDPHDSIALGHRRLAIIDVSDAGKQPFLSHDGRFVIVFNGEIYNYREIRHGLEGCYPFRTQTDTEVLLAAFIQWGEDCLERFNGMFAFAIWDRFEKRLFMARDRLGIKPLYYYKAPDETFYFSSEIKGILAFESVPRRLNRQGFLDYLSYRYPLGERTLFEGIYSLPPAHLLTVDRSGKMDSKRYWELPTSSKVDPGEDEALSRTEELLRQSVRYRMISDVPVGAFLSGGLDSSLLVALMSELSDEPIRTFSVGFDEEGYSELDEARVTATLFSTDHHEYLLTGREYFDLLPQVIRFKDAPLATQNEAALYFLSKKVKPYATVLLGGDGADELFAGYGRIFRNADRWSEMSSTLLDHFLKEYSYFNPERKEAILKTDLFAGCDLLNRCYFEDEFFSRLGHLAPIDQLLYVFQIVHLLGPLQRLDVPTMAASLEARVPFVDHRLVEYVSSLPAHYKLAWNSPEARAKAHDLPIEQISEILDTPKYLLKKIARKFLPDSIVDRKKLGFPAPLDRWFGTKFMVSARELLLSGGARSAPLYNIPALENWLTSDSSSVRDRHGMNVWMLINTEFWMQAYDVTL